MIGPDKKVKLTLTYPASTGRNVDEIVRVLDSLQLTADYKVATPVNWKDGEDVIIVPAVTDDEAKERFPKGFTAQSSRTSARRRSPTADRRAANPRADDRRASWRSPSTPRGPSRSPGAPCTGSASARCGSPGPGVWGPPADRDGGDRGAASRRRARRRPHRHGRLLRPDGLRGADLRGAPPLRRRRWSRPRRGSCAPGRAGGTRAGGPSTCASSASCRFDASASRRSTCSSCTVSTTTVDRDEQFALLAALLQEGKVRAVGLSEVSVEELTAARAVSRSPRCRTTTTSCTARARASSTHCAADGIGFIPYFPVAAGSLAGPQSAVASVAARTGATPAQVSLAWLLARSPVVLPIPGTSSVAHLEENCAASSVTLSPEDLASLDGLAAGAAG